jgi:hypothetical protein
VSTVEEVRETIPKYKRVWLILSNNMWTDPEMEIPKYLEAITHLKSIKYFIDITVKLYEVR